jgi:hypothetical protein
VKREGELRLLEHELGLDGVVPGLCHARARLACRKVQVTPRSAEALFLFEFGNEDPDGGREEGEEEGMGQEDEKRMKVVKEKKEKENKNKKQEEQDFIYSDQL